MMDKQYCWSSSATAANAALPANALATADDDAYAFAVAGEEVCVVCLNGVMAHTPGSAPPFVADTHIPTPAPPVTSDVSAFVVPLYAHCWLESAAPGALQVYMSTSGPTKLYRSRHVAGGDAGVMCADAALSCHSCDGAVALHGCVTLGSHCCPAASMHCPEPPFTMSDAAPPVAPAKSHRWYASDALHGTRKSRLREGDRAEANDLRGKSKGCECRVI